MGDSTHVLYVIYRDGKPVYTGFNGQSAYESVGGANRSIGKIVRDEVERRKHNARIQGAAFDEDAERQALRDELYVVPYTASKEAV